jgi:hypothetical protein
VHAADDWFWLRAWSADWGLIGLNHFDSESFSFGAIFPKCAHIFPAMCCIATQLIMVYMATHASPLSVLARAASMVTLQLF